jgi:hypothetical protein
MAQDDVASGPAHPLIESDHIEGTAVYDASGKRIGTVKRLVIEKVSGHVAYAITSFGGFLGLGVEVHSIPWEQLHYDTGLGGYRTSITEDQLRKAPEFSRQDEALLSGHERDELSQYYTIPPGCETL